MTDDLQMEIYSASPFVNKNCNYWVITKFDSRLHLPEVIDIFDNTTTVCLTLNKLQMYKLQMLQIASNKQSDTHELYNISQNSIIDFKKI